MPQEHHIAFIRNMLQDYMAEALKSSKDKRYEAILEVNGQMFVQRKELAEFNWDDFENIVALSFVNDTGVPDTYVRYLFSPKYGTFVLASGKEMP